MITKRFRDLGERKRSPVRGILGVSVALVALLAGSGSARADLGLQPRVLGMGGARAATAAGVEAIFTNPANLALPGQKPFEMSLVGLGLFAYNSSLSLHFYNRYNGDSLDDREKEQILAYFPDDGWKLGLLSEVPLLGLRIGRFGLGVQAVADGGITLPKELVRRPLYGIGMHETYRLEPFAGQAVGYAKATLAYAQPFRVPSFDRFAIGLGVGYVVGLVHAEILEARGYFQNDFNASLDWRVRARTGTLGSGYAVDLGMSAARGNFRFGLALTPVVSHIAWKEKTEEHFYWVSGDSLNVTRLDTLDADEVFDQRDSTYAVGAFSTSLPTQLIAGMAYQWGRLVLAVDYHQYFEKRYAHTTSPEFALGIESRHISFLPLRCGVSFGGGRKVRPSLGLGFYLPGLRWDIAIGGSGSMLPERWNGLSVGTSLRLAF
ncbi:MAG: hypothetical protein ONB23_10695 [candidate division KSB1 bacterium]|nr:hypothetical protein [candidate division KSB1 bacterium]